MKRSNEGDLDRWIAKTTRKPLIIRGARQVGKSTLVRQFAKAKGLTLLEINLERRPTLNEIFKHGTLTQIRAELEAESGHSLQTKQCLLFLDEIQAAPHAIAALRYFYEEMPDLPVIAAGSLLEFVLGQVPFSMPVGRIEYLHLGPMGFKEFLIAMGDDTLIPYLENYQLSLPFPEAAHRKLLDRQREFLFVGGMPEAILVYRESKSILEARHVHRSILQTYVDDFAKYARSTTLHRLHRVFDALPRIIGQKVKYSAIAQEERSTAIKAAIDLLTKARLLLPTYHSDCSGVPLKAGIEERIYKLFFLDIGLLNCLYGLDWTAISNLSERELVNEGILAEQFIAQQLAYRLHGLEAPELFYWLREKGTSNAEVDFVIAEGRELIPIEVKAGKSGTLKSLHQFILAKGAKRAVRFDLNLPSVQQLPYQVRHGAGVQSVSFSLLSLPLYFVEELPRVFRLSNEQKTLS